MSETEITRTNGGTVAIIWRALAATTPPYPSAAAAAARAARIIQPISAARGVVTGVSTLDSQSGASSGVKLCFDFVFLCFYVLCTLCRM